MSVWLQFDSGSRSNPYILQSNVEGNLIWVPNDYRYNGGQQQQTPANYRVFYGELNSPNNLRTLGFLEHCRERPENVTFNVEFCVATIPACARVERPADPVKGTPAEIVNVMDEPYIYIRLVDIEHSEGDLIYTNNKHGFESTFIAYYDKLQVGTAQDNCSAEPPSIPTIVPECDPPESANTWACVAPTIVPDVDNYGYTKYRWVIFKSCIVMPMRLNLESQEFQIQITDRFGKDLIILEDDNSGEGYDQLVTQPTLQPKPCPNSQTMVLVGIRPNYTIN